MLGANLAVGPYLERVRRALAELDTAPVVRLADRIEAAYRDGRTVFIAGNGGSAATASHLCEDLAKCTLRDLGAQRRLRVLSLTDNTPWLMAVANDLDYTQVFAEQLRNLARPGDLLVAISGSGNSPNVLEAVAWARAAGMETFGVTGFGGGRLRLLADDALHVPVDDMGIVESIHLTTFHWVVDDLYRRFGDRFETAPATAAGAGRAA